MRLVHRTWRLVLVVGLLAAAAGAALPTLAKGVGVSIVDKSFQPPIITVDAGDTVTWTVTKAIGEPHSVTAGKPGDTGTPVFDSGLNQLKDKGSSFQITFDTAGTFDYYCTVHPDVMKGQVVVLAVEEPVASDHKLIAGGILAVTLVLLFGAAWFWRRMNPA